MLELKNLDSGYDFLQVLWDVSLTVDDGEFVALIGPNGAGKTTFFNCITGIHPPTKGEMIARPPGKNKTTLNGLKPNIVTRCGLARTFQNIRLFQNMTVLENVMIGRHCRMSSGIAGAVFHVLHKPKHYVAGRVIKGNLVATKWLARDCRKSGLRVYVVKS